MTTKAWIASAITGTAVFVAASLLAVHWAERSALGGPGALAQGAPASPAAAARAISRPPEPAPVAAPSVPRVSAALPELPTSSSERAMALEPLRQEVFVGLASFDPRIEGCQLRDAELLLTLETMDGGVRVVEVQVAAAGAATAEATGIAPPPLDEHAVRCVRRTLEQVTFKASNAVTGRIWQMGYRPGTRP